MVTAKMRETPLRSSRWLVLVLLVSAAFLMREAHAGEPVKLYVALGGNDAWSGMLPCADGGRSDGPFATLDRARDEILRRKAAGQLASGATVLIRGGRYEQSETLVFTPDCSGETDAPVLFAAYENEEVILSGGRRISEWNVENGRWMARLPDVAAGVWDFAQLFVNNERRHRPRLPREGYWFVRRLSPASKAIGEGNYDRFRCGSDEILPSWSNPQDIELHFFHIWSTSRLRLKSVDGQEVATAGSTFRRLDRGTRYLVENVKEALERPGEWYLDRPTGVLTYIPLPGEVPGSTQVYAPRLRAIVELRGEPERKRWVRNLQFRGLTFAHSNWTTPPNGHCVSQAEFSMEAAVAAVGARDCSFTNCRFTHLSSYAVDVGKACKRNRLEGCEMSDLGAGGVKIGQAASFEDDELLASHNIVRDCLLAHGGRMHPAAVGVWIGQSHSNTVEHNEIFDFYYSGVSVGWTWGYKPNPCHGNIIAYNHIHGMPQEVLGDQGGIYTLGAQPGGVIRGNYIHDQYGVPWAVGIYLDEGSSQILVEDNLVHRVTTHALHCNYGRENLARNNIFACGAGGHIGRCRGEEHVTFTVERNIIYWEEGDLFNKGHPWDKGQYVFDWNLYWNPTQPRFPLRNWTWEEWQGRGQDRHSLIADPLFVDPRNADFTLKPGSPAEKIGFKPFDVRRAGLLTKNRGTTNLAPRAWPIAPRNAPDLPPEPTVQDFEGVASGAKCTMGMTVEDAKAGRARVTEETAASGTKCLKFVDAPGQKHFYNPHVYYKPGLTTGLTSGSFDLRWEAGAQLTYEWRDYTAKDREFFTGPRLEVAADGTLSSGGRELLVVPPGKWVNIKVLCKLGAQADGRFDLSVKLPDGQVVDFPELTYLSGFTRLDWCGFVSTKDDTAVFFIDNVGIEPDVTR